jgi:hypothetical protein
VSSYSASTTDGGDQTFTIDAQPPPAGIPDDGDGTDEVHVFTLSDDGGSSFTNAGFDLGPNFTATSFPSDTTGAFNASGSGPISTTGFDTIRVDTNFGLSGNGDVATLDGAARIEEVPVPSTLFLLGIALASVGVVTHQRNTT